jgi:hypothetical protein
MICAAHGASGATKSATKHLREYVVGVRALWRSFGGSEPVKVLALLWIAQDLIGLLDLFELLRVTAFVGVVFSGKFAIGLLDVIGRGVSGQTEDLVHLILIEN